MLNNVERITLRFPQDTVVDISGSPEVVAQIVKQLDGIEIVIKQKYFMGGKDE
jgi:hypothetical protein